jgi:hypothetical protein
MLIDGDAIEPAAAIVSATDFTAERDRRLFTAMLELHRSGSVVDPTTLGESLRLRGALEDLGGFQYIALLLDAVPTAANIEYHARLVRDRSQRRALFTAARALLDDPDEMAFEHLHRVSEHVERERAVLPRLPQPVSVRDLLDMPEPEEQFIAEGIIPCDANVVWAGYPKSHKTNALLELMVSAASATSFLGRFPVERPFRTGAVLMEDRAHRVRRRLHRICKAHHVALGDLQGRLSFWYRPPLRLSDSGVMLELARQIEQLQLQLLIVDSWSYVSSGNSDKSDDVTPQLQALAALRDRAPGLTIVLVHHARKAAPGQDPTGERLTDTIRNSTAFGAWYDTGIVLSRTDETSPVKVRAELRDLPAPAPFAFTVEDEYPASPDSGAYPTGWLRLCASDVTPAILEQRSRAARFQPDVLQVLRNTPGCSKRQLRGSIKGDDQSIEAAFEILVSAGLARFEAPEKKGQAGKCFLTDRGGTVVDRGDTTVGEWCGDRFMDPHRGSNGNTTPSGSPDHSRGGHHGPVVTSDLFDEGADDSQE